MFAGRSTDAESTVLPALSAWLQESLSDIPEARSYEDHGVVLKSDAKKEEDLKDEDSGDGDDVVKEDPDEGSESDNDVKEEASVRDALIAGKARLPHLGRAMTDVQELKQAAHWMAAARDERILCASVVLDQKPDGLQQYLADSVYAACRSDELKLTAFPDFNQFVQGLKEAKVQVQSQEFQVCVKRGACLVPLGAFANKWLESEQFKAEATAILEAHNSKYNETGDFVENETRTHSSMTIEMKLKT
eukprot:Skav233966  [mRNA]  locus=scaffold1008:449531:452135:+ [translate_table: standard]